MCQQENNTSLKKNASFYSVIETKITENKRITPDEAISLFEMDISSLGVLADKIKTRKHGKNVFFNKNFHIEPTNVCIYDCKFCSYSKAYKHKAEGWEKSKEEMLDIIHSYKGTEVTEVHIVGGVHPKMDIVFFGELLKEIKKILPEIHIKAFTAVELHYMLRKSKKTTQEGLEYLKECGLDSLPGGGAEIFDADIRERICADKCTSEEWLSLHKMAHEMGIPSNATMLYGHYESYGHRVDHMNRLRVLQDETKGFNTFIPLKFRNKNNQMDMLEEATVIDDIKTYAISRIFLDNFNHIKSYWPMLGKELTQTLLSFGVDDIDGTIDDSTKIYSMAGAEEQNPTMTTEEIFSLISETGNTPCERDTLYNRVKPA